MDRDSTGETPSALYPPQEAGFTLNHSNMQSTDAFIAPQHCLGRFGSVLEKLNADREIGFVDLLDEVDPVVF